jgi:hypothetical protein
MPEAVETCRYAAAIEFSTEASDMVASHSILTPTCLICKYKILVHLPRTVVQALTGRAKMPFPDYIPKHPSDDTRQQFEKDLKDLHLVYDYDAQNVDTGEPEKWRYEMWFFSPERIVYKIHGGPMAGRTNFQSASYQW